MDLHDVRRHYEELTLARGKQPSPRPAASPEPDDTDEVIPGDQGGEGHSLIDVSPEAQSDEERPPTLPPTDSEHESEDERAF
jgi:hypothetical protein